MNLTTIVLCLLALTNVQATGMSTSAGVPSGVVVECGNGVCESGEDCTNCAADCVIPLVACGNALCEAGNGENCVSCPQDCAGQQSGKPSNRFCCGFGGDAPDGCGDSRCTTGGFSCTETPVSGSSCCGDAVCEFPGESCSNCAADCAQGPELCTGGVDEDCDGLVDCADAACTDDLACEGVCTLGQTGDPCTEDSDCCSNKCKGKSGAKQCKGQ